MFDEIQAEHRDLAKSIRNANVLIARTAFLVVCVGPFLTLAVCGGLLYCAFKLVEIQRVKAVAPPQVQVEIPAGDLHE